MRTAVEGDSLGGTTSFTSQLVVISLICRTRNRCRSFGISILSLIGHLVSGFCASAISSTILLASSSILEERPKIRTSFDEDPLGGTTSFTLQLVVIYFMFLTINLWHTLGTCTVSYSAHLSTNSSGSGSGSCFFLRLASSGTSCLRLRSSSPMRNRYLAASMSGVMMRMVPLMPSREPCK